MKSTYSVCVDDGGSAQSGYVAFAGLWIDQPTCTQLVGAVTSTKRKHAVSYLHAKDVSQDLPKYQPIYASLFSALSPILLHGTRRHFWIRFGSASEDKANFTVLQNRTAKIIGQIGLAAAECELLSKPIAYMLLPVLALTNNTKIIQQVNTTIRYVIDQKNEYLLNLNKAFDVDTGKTKMLNTPGAFIAQKAINAYLKADGKTNVQFDETILANSKTFPEIELMDALSNFAWNWLKVEIADGYVPSPTESYKHNIFEDFLRKASEMPFDPNGMNSQLRAGFAYDGTTLKSKTSQPIGVLRLAEHSAP